MTNNIINLTYRPKDPILTMPKDKLGANTNVTFFNEWVTTTNNKNIDENEIINLKNDLIKITSSSKEHNIEDDKILILNLAKDYVNKIDKNTNQKLNGTLIEDNISNLSKQDSSNETKITSTNLKNYINLNILLDNKDNLDLIFRLCNFSKAEMHYFLNYLSKMSTTNFTISTLTTITLLFFKNNITSLLKNISFVQSNLQNLTCDPASLYKNSQDIQHHLLVILFFNIYRFNFLSSMKKDKLLNLKEALLKSKKDHAKKHKKVQKENHEALLC